jgi:uracil-DNA glycosylase family 4
MNDPRALVRLSAKIVSCRACPRLVAWREKAAAHPPRRFRGQRYWARPVPGFGDPGARLLVVGLAPAAHGGNRTGRVFTGDGSGDFLFAGLYRAGFASQPDSVSRDDGLSLRDAWIAAAVRCAPPDNRPTPVEFATCRPFLAREIAALGNLRVVLALGALAFRSALKALEENGAAIPRPRPAFAHGAEVELGPVTLFGSYHVSQQNTNTGRLTPAMFDAVLARIKRAAEEPKRSFRIS